MARQADTCPFARPFPDDFDRCAAYQRIEFVALDMQYRPLRTLNTCRHLDVGSAPGRRGTFYARCGLGDAEARRRWVERVEADRLLRIRALGAALGDATRELTRQLWEAKADQLRALRAGEPAAPSNRQLRRLAREYEQTAKALMLHRRIELEELHLPVDACMALIREVMADWITKTSLERGWEPSNRLLQRFPLDVRILLQPHPTRKAG
jgi:hypothetical protein